MRRTSTSNTRRKHPAAFRPASRFRRAIDDLFLGIYLGKPGASTAHSGRNDNPGGSREKAQGPKGPKGPKGQESCPCSSFRSLWSFRSLSPPCKNLPTLSLSGHPATTQNRQLL